MFNQVIAGASTLPQRLSGQYMCWGTMRAKRSNSDSGDITRKTLVADLHAAVQAYVEGGAGKLLRIDSVETVAHKAMQFDMVIKCIGQRPNV